MYQIRHAARAGLVALSLVLMAGSGEAADGVRMTGVNLAGGEFNGGKIPGTLFKDYVYPDQKTMDYFIDQGMNVFRVPFRWERLQPVARGPLDREELSHLDKVVSHATGRGAHVILDPHNYARYFREPIGTEGTPRDVFAAFWEALARHYQDNPLVVFGLMNEPHGLRAADWAISAQAAVDAIRGTGARNLILVPGTLWTGAHSWLKHQVGGSNGDALEGLSDPVQGGVVFEVHQYLDRDYSGTSETCRSAEIGVEKLAGFTEWLRRTGSVGFLGEFGVGANDTCLVALDAMLGHIDDNADVWLGWTYWAAGAWWGDYFASVQPSDDGDAKPQMRVLLNHLADR